MVTCRARR